MGIILLFLTNLIFPLAALGVVLGFLFSGRRGLLVHLKQELRERFGLEKENEIVQGAIWFHCASVGEVLSIKELIAQFKAIYGRDILITTSTQAGKETALKNPLVNQALLVPLDFYPSCRRFLRLARPHRLFVVEREIWPNLLEAAFQAGVPTALLNGRISARSARAYALIKPLFSRVLKHLAFAALQTQADAEHYLRLGLPKERCFVCGNVKYDALSDVPARTEQADELFKNLGWIGKQVIVLGSTHPQEETMLLRAAPELVKRDIKIVFAPRHLERMPEIRATLRQSGLVHAFVSDESVAKNATVLCVDKMGLLPAFYSRAALTFVGGSVAPRGAHNLLEPAILAKTVLFGKHFYNTPITAQALLENGGGVLVDEYNFKTIVLRLLGDKEQLDNMAQKARNTALSFQGATHKIREVVENYERKSN